MTKLALAVAVPGNFRSERISGCSNGLMNYLPVQVTGSFSGHGAQHSASANDITVNLTKGRQYLHFASEPTVYHVNSATGQVTLHGDTGNPGGRRDWSVRRLLRLRHCQHHRDRALSRPGCRGSSGGSFYLHVLHSVTDT